MQAVSITEFTSYLSRYMEIVRLGGEVVLLDEAEKPIARLIPVEPTGDADLDRLVALGILRPGRGDPRKILDTKPLKLPASVLEALLEERGRL